MNRVEADNSKDASSFKPKLDELRKKLKAKLTIKPDYNTFSPKYNNEFQKLKDSQMIFLQNE